MEPVYGVMVKSVSGQLMAVVTNGSTFMSLKDYATHTERNCGNPPVLATKEEVGGYEITFKSLDVDIENGDPYERKELISFGKEDAILLAKKILNYYGEEL